MTPFYAKDFKEWTFHDLREYMQQEMISAFVTGGAPKVLNVTHELGTAVIQWHEDHKGVDGAAFNLGRSEGQADVAVRLRKIVDPEDKHHLSLDGTLAAVSTFFDSANRVADNRSDLAEALVLTFELLALKCPDDPEVERMRSKLKKVLAKMPLTKGL